MLTDKSVITEMLSSMGNDASHSIAMGIQTVRSEASLNGAYGGPRMHLAINRRAADIFRSAATAMANKTRAYAGAEAAATADLGRELINWPLSGNYRLPLWIRKRSPLTASRTSEKCQQQKCTNVDQVGFSPLVPVDRIA